MPSRGVITRRLEKKFFAAKEKLKTLLQTVRFVCTTADGWTSRRRSFLGVTVHWFDPATLRRRSAVLAMKRLKGKHTFDLLASKLSKIHKDFGLTPEKIVKTITDSGSNFIKAFHVYGLDDDATAASTSTQPSKKPVRTSRNTSLPEPERLDDDLSSDDDSDEEQDGEIHPINVTTILNGSEDPATFQGFDDYELPEHFRCIAHLLNLVSKKDVPKEIAAGG